MSTDIESRAPYVIMTLCMTGYISDVELDPLVSDLQSVGITSTSQATYQTIGVTSISQATYAPPTQPRYHT